MKTMAILSRKGGAGKTTIAVHLAVAAEAMGLRTALFDLDPQASAAIWNDTRAKKAKEANKPKPPPAVTPAQGPRLPALLEQARAQQADLVILDTAPHDDAIASEAATHADAILIPCRPSSFDLSAIGASVKLANAAGKPAYVVINAAPSQGVETAQTRNALEKAGVAVSPVVLHQRKAFASFIQDGGTAQEMEPKGQAAEEIRALVLWLQQITSKQVNKRVIKRAS